VAVVSGVPIARCHWPRMGVCGGTTVPEFQILPPVCHRSGSGEVSIWRILCLICMRIEVKHVSTVRSVTLPKLHCVSVCHTLGVTRVQLLHLCG
jgi:hypothetical protein